MSRGTPVVPYARVIPVGVRDGKLAITVQLSPDSCRADSARAEGSPITLERWPSDVARALSELAAEDGTLGVPIEIRPVPDGDGTESAVFVRPRELAGSGQTVTARLVGLERLSEIDLETATARWTELFERANWPALAGAISDSLEGRSITTGHLGTEADGGANVDRNGIGYVPPPPTFGDRGQIAPVGANGDDTPRATRIDTVLEVPHADLAMSIEFQRVDELLRSFETGDADDRIAEAERRAIGGAVDADTFASVVRDRAARREESDRTALSHGVPGGRPEDPTAARDGGSAPEAIAREEETKEAVKSLKMDEREQLSRELAPQRERSRERYDTRRSGILASEAVDERECAILFDEADNTPALDASTAAVAPNEREDVFGASSRAHAYATWPQHHDGDRPETTPRLSSAHSERFFAVQSMPSLSRLFCLTLDAEIDLGEIDVDDLKRVRYAFLASTLTSDFERRHRTRCLRPVLWSLCKFRNESGAPRFLPASESELAMHRCGRTASRWLNQFEGSVVMGGTIAGTRIPTRRFDLTSIDVRSATEMEMQRRQVRAANAISVALDADDVAEPDAERAYWNDLAFGATLPTAGLTLMCRTMRNDAVDRIAARIVKANADARAHPWGESPDESEHTDGSAGEHPLDALGTTVLDADDLTIGYRLYVGMPAPAEDTSGADEGVSVEQGDGTPVRTRWFPLMTRRVRFDDENGDRGIEGILERLIGAYRSNARTAIDSAFYSTPSRLLPTTKGDPFEAVVEQAVVTWSGGPMGVECASSAAAEGDAPPSDVLPFTRTLSLPTAGDERPVAARFGWPYRLAKAAVYSGGRSVSPGDRLPDDRSALYASVSADLDYPPASLARPSVRPFFRFLRQSRLEAPVVLLPKGHAKKANGPMGHDSAAHLIVRSALGDASGVDSRLDARAVPAIAQRILLVPTVSIEAAARHGVFDGRRNGDARRAYRGALTRVGYGDGDPAFPESRLVTVKGIDDRPFLKRVEVPGEPAPRRLPGENVASGTGLFGRANADGRRSYPYHPDPAGEGIAVALRYPGRREYLPGFPVVIPVLEKEAYPDFLPLVLTFERLELEPAEKGTVPRLREIRRGPVRFDPDRRDDITLGSRLRGVELRLASAAGTEYEIDCWCVPGAQQLAEQFSVVQSLGITLAQCGQEADECTVESMMSGAAQRLDPEHYRKLESYVKDGCRERSFSYIGPGGMVCPENAALKALGRLLRDRLGKRPVREISAVRTLRGVHGANRPPVRPRTGKAAAPDVCERPEPVPVKDPSERDRRPLLAIRPKALDRKSLPTYCGDAATRSISLGSTRLALSGDVDVDLTTIDTLEIIAETVLPGSSDFDDANRGRSLEHRAAGTVPRSSVARDANGLGLPRSATDLFGFRLDKHGRTEHPRSLVTLLRVENLPFPTTLPESGRSRRDGEPAANRVPEVDCSPEAERVVRGAEAAKIAVEAESARIALEDLFFRDEAGALDKVAEEEGAAAAEPVDQVGRITFRHTFPDGKARILYVRVNGLCRTVSAMHTLDRVAEAGDAWLSGDGLVYRKNDLVPGESVPAAQQENLSRSGDDGDEAAARTSWSSEAVRVVMPATRRPAKCDTLTPVPVFAWRVERFDSTDGPRVEVRRDSAVRLYFRRGWFSSGQGERIGIVLWPPNLRPEDEPRIDANRIPLREDDGTARYADLSGFADEDLGEGGRFITRRGGDPVRGGGDDRRVFLSHDDFVDLDPNLAYGQTAVYVPSLDMPLDDFADDDREGDRSDSVPPLRVGLVTYEPLFDAERELWYADVSLRAHQAADPFVRFGLVRYQPYTAPELGVSRPVFEFSQLVPRREASIRLGEDARAVIVTLRGHGSYRRKVTGYGRRSDEDANDAPFMRVRLFEESTDRYGGPIRSSVAHDDDERTEVLVRPSLVEGWLEWTYAIPTESLRPVTGQAVLQIEEIERFRPSEYEQEPIDIAALTESDPFVESGPRFNATVDITEFVPESS